MNTLNMCALVGGLYTHIGGRPLISDLYIYIYPLLKWFQWNQWNGIDDHGFKPYTSMYHVYDIWLNLGTWLFGGSTCSSSQGMSRERTSNVWSGNGPWRVPDMSWKWPRSLGPRSTSDGLFYRTKTGKQWLFWWSRLFLAYPHMTKNIENHL